MHSRFCALCVASKEGKMFFYLHKFSARTYVLYIMCRAEINIKPWEGLLKDLEEGNNRSKWMEREPYAYWKGNPFVSETRRDLLNCNLSDTQDWNARLYVQVIIIRINNFLQALLSQENFPHLKIMNVHFFG